MPETFEAALQSRADAMADACTRCGKCVEVCPVTEAAGLSAAERQHPADVISGIIDIVRHGDGNAAARQWASGCVLSGDCIKACDYGVNPRFLLYMARIEMARSKDDAAARRRTGVEGFRKLARDVRSYVAYSARRCAAGASRPGQSLSLSSPASGGGKIK